MVDGQVSLRTEAWGGAKPQPGVNYDPMDPRETTPGRYLVHSYSAYHRIDGVWLSSKIRWGARLRVERVRNETQVFVETDDRTRRWQLVSDLIPGITTREIQLEFRHRFGFGGRYDLDGDGIPDVWVFNDCGPKAVRYFRDRNHNGRLDRDKGEKLSGEMIHTTPINEGQAEQGLPVTLVSSHGCIHIAPAARDAFAAAGAFKRGTQLIIHPYSESTPEVLH